ncbi:hypothetical protein BH100B_01611 [Escherichia coli]|nr:hypothetical protein BH100B_01611 [Escherichia coli]
MCPNHLGQSLVAYHSVFVHFFLAYSSVYTLTRFVYLDDLLFV